METLEKTEYKLLDKGYVKVIDWMGDDFTPESTARISTGSEERDKSDGIILTRYLMRHKHTSPFEFCNLVIEIKAPIMTFRQFFRHRTISVNEESGRYQQLGPDYYLPEVERICLQSKSNHQGTDFNNQHPHAPYYQVMWADEQHESEKFYDSSIKDGLSNELARLNMPVSHYSTARVSANLLNWFRFCQLREDAHAQYEIRVYAEAIHAILKELFPECTAAYEDYWLHSITFTARESNELKCFIEDRFGDLNEFSESLKCYTESNGHDVYWTKREKTEFLNKVKRILNE